MARIINFIKKTALKSIIPKKMWIFAGTLTRINIQYNSLIYRL